MTQSEPGFAVDTNLLAYPTSRRLLHGIALETGQRIFLLPEVYKELSDGRILAQAEVERFARRDPHLLRSMKGSIERVLQTPATEWLEHDAQSEDTPFVRIWANETDRAEIAQVARGLPRHVFSGLQVNNRGVGGDPTIVAEGIYFDVDILSSNNLNTIDHEGLNDWLSETTGRNVPLIYRPSTTIEALCRDDMEQAYRWLMSHGMNRVYSHEDDNRAEFAKTLRVLESGGFRRKFKRRGSNDAFMTIVYRIEQLFLVDRQFSERLEAARASPHRQRAIDLELKLNALVNRAVQCHMQGRL